MNRAWHLLVCVCAGTGVLLAARQYDVWWTALSQLACIAVALTYGWLALGGRRSAWLQGLLASLVTLVATAYLPMANGNLTDGYSILEHIVTPALVVADFIVVARHQAGYRWWWPLSWLVPPALYLWWYVGADLQVYAALDPSRTGEFWSRSLLLLLLLLSAGYAALAVHAAKLSAGPAPVATDAAGRARAPLTGW